MDHYKTVEIPATEAHTEQKFDFTACDLCGKDVDECPPCDKFDVNDVTIEHRLGKNFPEGSWGSTRKVDMCGDCFTNLLVPWLKSQGATPREEDWDW